MHVLLLETSVSHGDVALADESGLLQSAPLLASRRQARDLVPSIRDLCANQKLAVKEIDWLIVDVGPGSYTGLRVGLATAKMIGYVNKANLVTATTMEVVAHQVPEGHRDISVIVDAQQGNIYHQRFAQSEGEVVAKDDIAISRVEDWADELAEGCFVTGPGLDRFEERIPDHCTKAAPEIRQPRSQGLWRVGLPRIQANLTSDIYKLEPLYLRASAAEIKWNKRQEQKA